MKEGGKKNVFEYVTFSAVLPGTGVGRNLLSEMERKGFNLQQNKRKIFKIESYENRHNVKHALIINRWYIVVRNVNVNQFAGTPVLTLWRRNYFFNFSTSCK